MAYAIQDYLSSNSIADEKLRQLWDKAKEILDETIIKCTKCDGKGWYNDHTDLHHKHSNSPDCSEFGCPVQRQCEACKGKGSVDK